MNRTLVRVLLIVSAVLSLLRLPQYSAGGAPIFLILLSLIVLGAIASFVTASLLKDGWSKALQIGLIAGVAAILLQIVLGVLGQIWFLYLDIVLDLIPLVPAFVVFLMTRHRDVAVVPRRASPVVAAVVPTATEAGGVAEGWYADPNGLPSERFWDGSDWTDKTRPVTTATIAQRAAVSAPGKLAVDQDGNPVSPSSRLVALLLNIFLGVLGVHRFYVGKVGTGVAMLLTFGGFGIWALVDFILILAGAFRDKDNRRVLNW